MAETSYIYIYITVTYLAYILFLIEFVNCPLPLKTGIYLNPFQYFLMDSSHTHTWILIRIGIPILNHKFGIWIFRHPTIDIHSKYYFYNVLTLDYTSPCPGINRLWSPAKYSELNLHLVPSITIKWWPPQRNYIPSQIEIKFMVNGHV